MAIDKITVPNIDNSDPANFPNARIKDNPGNGSGTPINRLIASDMFEFFAKLMRLAALTYNNLPDSEGNGYQLIDALIALAGKNDMVTPLNTVVVVISGVNTNVVYVPLNLSLLKLNEALVCKSAFDITTETQIVGTVAGNYVNITVPSAFKNGDYIRLIKTSVGYALVRLADGGNLNVLVNELLYLKGATPTDEYAGTSQILATTPYTNQLAFARRVIGVDSSIFLASHTRNGLLSAAQWDIIQNIPVNPIKNVGSFAGLDVGAGSPGDTYACTGDITAAVLLSLTSSDSVITVTMANPMANLNYVVWASIQSQGSMGIDNDCATPVFTPISTTQFRWSISEILSGTQSLKVHLQVVQI